MIFTLSIKNSKSRKLPLFFTFLTSFFCKNSLFKLVRNIPEKSTNLMFVKEDLKNCIQVGNQKKSSRTLKTNMIRFNKCTTQVINFINILVQSLYKVLRSWLSKFLEFGVESQFQCFHSTFVGMFSISTTN